MGVFIDILKRDGGDDARQEDLSMIYHPGEFKFLSWLEPVYEGEYKNHIYEILSYNGVYPVLRLYSDMAACWTEINCKNSSGRNMRMKSNGFSCFTYEYNSKFDYATGIQEGKKHGLNDIIRDVEAVIDGFIVRKASYLRERLPGD